MYYTTPKSGCRKNVSCVVNNRQTTCTGILIGQYKISRQIHHLAERYYLWAWFCKRPLKRFQPNQNGQYGDIGSFNRVPGVHLGISLVYIHSFKVPQIRLIALPLALVFQGIGHKHRHLPLYTQPQNAAPQV